MDSGTTGYADIVAVENGPSKVLPDKLLNVYWEIHDLTTGTDRVQTSVPSTNWQYFFYTPEQESAVRASKERLERAGRYKNPIGTAITPASQFYNAEEYHRQYLEKQGLSHYTIK